MAQSQSKILLSKIIKEEVKNFLDGVVIKEQSDNDFRTNVSVDMDTRAMIIHGIVKDNDESLSVNLVRKQEVPIKWSVEYEYRNWGIKGIYPSVPDQKILVSFERDSGLSYDEFEKEILLKNVQVEIVEPSELHSSIGLSLGEIEFYGDKITAKFYI
jgi:hypothetical protein